MMEPVISYLEWCAESIRRGTELYMGSHMTGAQAHAFDRAAAALRGDAEAWAACVAPSHREAVLTLLGDEAGELLAIGNTAGARRFEDAVIALVGMEGKR